MNLGIPEVDPVLGIPSNEFWTLEKVTGSSTGLPAISVCPSGASYSLHQQPLPMKTQSSALAVGSGPGSTSDNRCSYVEYVGSGTSISTYT